MPRKNDTQKYKLCCVVDGSIDFAVKKFIEKEKNKIRCAFEMVELQEYHSKIAYLAGEKKSEDYLNF